jgi:hypothetical protein
MPSPLRVAIVVTQVQHHLLSRLSELEGRSQASYVRRVLDIATPSLARVLEALEARQAVEEAIPPEVHEHILRQLDEEDARDAEDAARYGDDPLADQLDLELEDYFGVLRDPEQPQPANDDCAPAASAASEDAQPSEPPSLHPSSNTGVSSAGHEPEGGSKRTNQSPRRG